jgi:hypothetical protein
MTISFSKTYRYRKFFKKSIIDFHSFYYSNEEKFFKDLVFKKGNPKISTLLSLKNSLCGGGGLRPKNSRNSINWTLHNNHSFTEIVTDSKDENLRSDTPSLNLGKINVKPGGAENKVFMHARFCETKPYKTSKALNKKILPNKVIAAPPLYRELSGMASRGEISSDIKEKFLSLDFFETGTEDCDINNPQNFLKDSNSLCTNSFFSSQFKWGLRSPNFFKNKVFASCITTISVSENKFNFPNRKKKVDWVCYSQSQYSMGQGALQQQSWSGSPRETVATFAEAQMTLEFSSTSKPILDEFQLINLNKNLFERQNILRCYKERNLLRLILAFFDSTNNTEKFSVFELTQTIIPQNLSRFQFKNFQFSQFFDYGFTAGFAPIKKVLRKIRLKISSKTPAFFILIQIFIIPYTFLFGIFYTCFSFQVSSTLTAKNYSNWSTVTRDNLNNSQKEKSFLTKKIHLKQNDLKNNTFLEGLTSPTFDNLYSYSIQVHPIPYEVLRLSHFSSKLFILWGFLTIWKGVRPSKSTRNEYIIQTRLLTPNKNRKRFQDVEGVEKFFPIFKTLLESFSSQKLGGLKTKVSTSLARGFTAAKLSGYVVTREAPQSPNQQNFHGLNSSIKMIHPKGYLFIGPPGTGKTLLAQAIAGEAQVNLICLSASEIQKQIDIGTRIGAIRLRNLFEQARKNTPCILFLDEIDAIGRARNESMDLKLFTEFLIQMDSFSVKDGFILIGTTNFLSSLDSAFIRSGRFDRIIGLNYPGKQTRIAILKLYTQKGKNIFDQSISWNYFGEKTKGLSAADLAKVVNESSLYLIQLQILSKKSVRNSLSGIVSPVLLENSHSIVSSGAVEEQSPPLQQNLLAADKYTQSQGTFADGFIPRKKFLVHTTESLERGIERISRGFTS